MKTTFTALVAIATVAGSLAVATPPAQADGGRIAAGVAGGLLGGALLGAAIANSRPAYAAPPPAYVAPAPVYVEEPPCHVERERFWDGYGWRMRHIRVCD
ncbi:MAG: hypothetical protein WBA29_18815 [Xanthobacteraceae bacterium]